MGINQTDKAERRAEPRYPARLQAVIEDEQHGRLVFMASGFSRTGAFLRRDDGGTPLPMIGSLIKISFNWPIETHIPPVTVEAKVVRQTNEGVGVQFEFP